MDGELSLLGYFCTKIYNTVMVWREHCVRRFGTLYTVTGSLDSVLRLRTISAIIIPEMKHTPLNDQGLIPLLLAVFAVVVGIIYFAFSRVSQAQ